MTQLFTLSKSFSWRTRPARLGTKLFTILACLPIGLIAAELPGDAHESPEHGKTDFSRLVVVGDSLSAGFQNGSLLGTQQVHGYASLVAEKARTALPLPLIAAPGIPNVLTLVKFGPPPVISPAPGVSTGRLDPRLQAMDVAVPGANVQDALTTRPTFRFDNLTDFVVGLPGAMSGISRSQIEWAENLAPTVVFVWIGNNDALGAALAGDATRLTPVANFQAAYSQVMQRLQATHARLVLANIPDVTSIPYLTPAETVAAQIGLPLFAIGPVLGIGPGDFVTPDALSKIPAILSNPSLGPLPGNVVLDAKEVATIQTAVDAYNSFIAAEAHAHRAALVDIHALTARFHKQGVEVGGERLTTNFLGGLFSLDGVHPTNTGYALIGNEFIRAINETFDTELPEISVRSIAAQDPLVPPRATAVKSSLNHISPETARSLQEVVLHRSGNR